MERLVSALLLILSSSLHSGQPMTAQGDLNLVYIESVSVIPAAFVGHLAGHMELKIKGGFTLQAGVSCDNNYITTLKTVDADKRLFALLSIAQVTKQPVILQISDHATYTAFGGRCSVLGASLAQ